MILEAKNIVKTYKNGSKTLEVLKDINISLEQGEILSIMGPSGSGKSTLLNILGTLDDPDEGEILIKDVNISSLSEDNLAKLRNQSIGFVFQFHHLLPEFTAYENVLIPTQFFSGQEPKSKWADELFKYFELEDRTDHYPSQLSGGERLRVAVLRALINDPDLVLADEPTGNLDQKNASRLLDLFSKIQKDFNKSFILTTHNPQVAKIGTHSLYLENGSLNKY